MKKATIFAMAILTAWACVAAAETVILDEDFGGWLSGTIDGAYTLPGGWSMITSGMVVGFENAQTGKTVKCVDGTQGTIRFTWTPVDPTTANPLKIVLYMRLGTQSKVEKGALLHNAGTITGGCDPTVYWYEYPASSIGSREYRVRDRVNCSPSSATAVYGTSATTFTFASDDLRQWVKWEIVCDDTQAELFKDDVSQGTFAGAPNALLDNFEGIDIGSPDANWWTGDFGVNGDIWFDRIQIIQGPFGPAPTPTPVPGSVNLPFYDDFDGYTTIGDVKAIWIVDSNNWNLSSTQHTAGGSKSLQNAEDTKIEQNAEVAWSPVEPLAGFPIRISFWWRLDAQGGPNDKLDKFARIANDAQGQAGTSWVNFGANWSAGSSTPNGTGLVDSDSAYANITSGYHRGANCTTEVVWQEWVFEAETDRCTLSKDGDDFLSCVGLTTGSGAPSADLLTYPWNAFHVGAFYGTAWGRGYFWIDDVVIEGPPSTGIDEWDWASY